MTTNNNESNFKSKFVAHICISEPNTPDPLIIICITVTGFFYQYSEFNLMHFLFNLLRINPLNAQLNPICHLLALLGAHRILYVRR
jgi:hypothetical protein